MAKYYVLLDNQVQNICTTLEAAQLVVQAIATAVTRQVAIRIVEMSQSEDEQQAA